MITSEAIAIILSFREFRRTLLEELPALGQL
jgi:hypothetical protein